MDCNLLDSLYSRDDCHSEDANDILCLVSSDRILFLLEYVKSFLKELVWFKNISLCFASILDKKSTSNWHASLMVLNVLCIIISNGKTSLDRSKLTSFDEVKYLINKSSDGFRFNLTLPYLTP